MYYCILPRLLTRICLRLVDESYVTMSLKPDYLDGLLHKYHCILPLRLHFPREIVHTNTH